MNCVDEQAGLSSIAWNRSDIIGALQAHLGNEGRDAVTWYSLGLSLMAENRYEEAAAAFHAALTLSPHHIGIEFDYATALSNSGALREAAEFLEDVIHRSPGDGMAYFHLATLRYNQGNCELASQLWECAARLLDDPMDCFENLAMVSRRLGEVDSERRYWQRAAKHGPTNPIVSHMLAAVGLTPAPPQADNAYIVSLFDRFAPDFDMVLAKLQYRVPDLCEDWMRDQFGPPRHRLRVLDAGCGTGLCGERLRPWSAELFGVDLSSGMLEHAARRGIYEKLERADLLEFLRSYPGRFDVVVAGDVLCYFGDISAFVQYAMASLREGGQLGFSVEGAREDEIVDHDNLGYIIQHHGRYAHTCRHIKHALRGVASRFKKIVLRLEFGQSVHGYWVSAKHANYCRPSDGSEALLLTTTSRRGGIKGGPKRVN